jgi:hypothetical protein
MTDTARYFVHVDGFSHGTAYVMVKGQQSFIVSVDGTAKKSTSFKLPSCETFVRRGMWKELTAAEADRLAPIARIRPALRRSARS